MQSTDPGAWWRAYTWALCLAARTRRDERGDVPGWVMITVMTAGLVALLTAVAGPQLKSLLQNALSSVGG